MATLLDDLLSKYYSGQGSTVDLAALQDAAGAGLLVTDANNRFQLSGQGDPSKFWADTSSPQNFATNLQELGAIEFDPRSSGTPTYSPSFNPAGAPTGSTPSATSAPALPSSATPSAALPGTTPTASFAAPDSELMRTLLENIKYFTNLRDQSSGLSPETQSILRTQSREAIPAQFDRAEADLMTDLLRRSGYTGLPGGGEFLQGYAPLQAAKESAIAGSEQNLILQNEAEKRRTLDANRQYALAAMGQGNTLFNTLTQERTAQAGLANQLTLANLDANTRLELARMGITSDQQLAEMQRRTQLELGGLQANTQLTLGNLDAQTRERLAQMGIVNDQLLQQMQSGTQLTLANLDAQTRTQLAQMGITSDRQLAELQSRTQLEIANIQSKAGSFLQGNLLPSLISTAGGPLINGLVNTLFGGDKQKAAEAVATIGTTAGSTAAAGSGGFGAAVTGFMTNPITIGVGAALVAGAMIIKSQAHWEANTFVQNIENPIGETLSDIHDNFFALMGGNGSPQIDRNSAIQMRASVQALWDEFKAKATAFAKGGSDEKLVATQGQANLGQYFTLVLNGMDDAINKYLPA